MWRQRGRSECPAEWWALRLILGCLYAPLSIAAMPPVSERLAVQSAVRSLSPYIRPRTGRSVVKNPVELIRCHMHRERRRIQLRVLQRSADVPHRHLVSEAVRRASQVVPDDGADRDRDLMPDVHPCSRRDQVSVGSGCYLVRVSRSVLLDLIPKRPQALPAVELRPPCRVSIQPGLVDAHRAIAPSRTSVIVAGRPASRPRQV